MSYKCHCVRGLRLRPRQNRLYIMNARAKYPIAQRHVKCPLEIFLRRHRQTVIMKLNEPINTPAKLTRACKLWQKRLRLQDWDVIAKFDTKQEMAQVIANGDSCVGACDYHINLKCAKIHILRPELLGESQDSVTTILIHELLHLHFAHIDDDDHFWLIEQAIDCIAQSYEKSL